MTTATNAAKATLIEERAVKGAYDMSYTEAIVDHPKHGRIYISEGWGSDKLGSECYRWSHGWIISIPADADFAWLDGDSRWEDCGIEITRLAALREALAVDGCELMHWFNGWAIRQLAESVGL